LFVLAISKLGTRRDVAFQHNNKASCGMQGLIFFSQTRLSRICFMQLLFNSWQSSGKPLSACSYCAAKRATAQLPVEEVKGENCLASARAIVAQILLVR
jgi:hypothetical protein